MKTKQEIKIITSMEVQIRKKELEIKKLKEHKKAWKLKESLKNGNKLTRPEQLFLTRFTKKYSEK